MRNRTFIASIFIMGLSGIVAQVVLLRELLVSFYGNELTIGIILAGWLLLEAAGSFIFGKTLEKIQRKMEGYVFLQLIFSMAFPAAIYLCRVFKSVFLASPGEAMGFFQIFAFSLLVLLFVALPHGALFTYGSKLYSRLHGEDSLSIGNVYFLETVGSLVGGLLISFFFIQYFNSFEIAMGVSFLNALFSAHLLRQEKNPFFTANRYGLLLFSIFLSLVFAVLLFSPLTGRINQASIRSQWKNLNVVYNGNSVYGNITVTRGEEQFTFFTDGVPAITVPVPDTAAMEDFVHFPMLFHERPRSVLVLSNGVGGMIREILKHPVTRVDYVELDPLLLKLVRRFSTPLTEKELSDPRVHVHDMDSRLYLNETGERFDLIFIGLAGPQDLRTNRLFTHEFFEKAMEKMTSHGMIVLGLPGSLTYLSGSLRALNGCILGSLKSVYPYVRVIVGETNLYLASPTRPLEEEKPEALYNRLKERKIESSLLTREYIEVRLHPRWLKWYWQSMDGQEVRINSDLSPIGVFFNLSYWNTLFSPYFSRLFKTLEELRFGTTILAMILWTLLLSAFCVLQPRRSGVFLPYAIFTTGLTGMMFNLAILFTFQTLLGYLYHQLGLLLTAFMVGIALTSFFLNRQLPKIKKGRTLFLSSELGIIFFSFLLPWTFSLFLKHIGNPETYFLFYPLFLFMSLLSGAFIGFQFPLATKIYLDTSDGSITLGKTAGLFYGADLLGGFWGGLFGGTILLPIIGLEESCYLMAMIKISSFFPILLSYRLLIDKKKKIAYTKL